MTCQRTVKGFLGNPWGSVKKVAAMHDGGLVVSSYDDGQLYAKTVVQIDGDICTMILQSLLCDDAYQDLMDRHYNEVSFGLSPVRQLGQGLNRIRMVLPLFGVIIGLILGSAVEVVIGFIFGLILIMLGVFVKQLFRIAVQWQFKKLLEKVRVEGDEYYSVGLAETKT